MSNMKNTLYDPVDWDAYDYWGQDVPAAEHTGCQHDYVNVSFNHVVMACKYCGQDKPGEANEKII